jgi:ferredoxin like protein
LIPDFLKVEADTYRPDPQFTHIVITDPEACSPCEEQACMMVCPVGVFERIPGGRGMTVRYDRCVECAACYIACPSGNLSFDYPRGGFGIRHLYG